MILSSTDWPFSSLFSISISKKPSLSAFEMSNTPPTAAVSTPPDRKTVKPPQTWRVCSFWAASRAHLHADQCPGWMDR
uniref:Uncharacterized protein n=1 Tax=Anabas testudineus TaxID=64144 RepID=A0A7N6AQC4_ANATE